MQVSQKENLKEPGILKISYSLIYSANVVHPLVLLKFWLQPCLQIRAILLDPSCSGSGIATERLDYLLPSFNKGDS